MEKSAVERSQFFHFSSQSIADYRLALLYNILEFCDSVLKFDTSNKIVYGDVFVTPTRNFLGITCVSSSNSKAELSNKYILLLTQFYTHE